MEVQRSAFIVVTKYDNMVSVQQKEVVFMDMKDQKLAKEIAEQRLIMISLSFGSFFICAASCGALGNFLTTSVSS